MSHAPRTAVGLSTPSGGPAPTVDAGARSVLAVLDRAEVPVAVLDDAGVLLSANAAFALLCGRPAGELEHRNLTEFVLDDDRHRVPAMFEQAPVTSDDGVQARVVGADGRVRPLRLHTGPLTTAGADRRQFICIAHDLSDQRRHDRRARDRRLEAARAETVDPATGLPNRKGLEMVLDSAARRSTRNHTPFALLQCEITRGAAPGTPLDGGLLHACLDRVRQRLRPADTVTLLDGAVAVVAEDLHDEQDGAGVAYRLLSTVVEPIPTADGPVAATMAIGVAMADATTAADALVTAAQEAAAHARDGGGFRLTDLRTATG